jgi:RecA-family ATPase
VSHMDDDGSHVNSGEQIILPTFAEIDALHWTELKKLPDDALSEFDRLTDDEIENLTDDQSDAMQARHDERLKRKYCGKLPDEIAEERDLDVSKEPAWFQALYATDLGKLTTAELEWRRANKWDRGTVEQPNPLPDGAYTDDDEDAEYFVSDKARSLWHRRIWTMTRNEFEEWWSRAREPKVIAHFLILDEQERREMALLILGADDSQIRSLHEEIHGCEETKDRPAIEGRIDAIRKLSPDALADLIARLTVEKENADAAARAKLAEWRRRNEEIEQAAHAQHEKATERTPPEQDAPRQDAPHSDKPRGYEALRGNAQQAKPIHWVRASDLAKKPTPRRSWLIENLIPGRNVTLLTGDGGTGKSLVALQLAVATASTGQWLNLKIETVDPVLFYSAEDDINENQIRLGDICAAEGIAVADLGDLHIAPLAGLEAMLSTFDSRSSQMRPSQRWLELRRKADAIRPKLVVIDTAADAFSGDENKRKEVRQFVGLLRGLALDFDCAVVLLAHPSVTGIIDGTGRSGTTGWANSVRSRLNFERIIDRSQTPPVEPDRKARRLSNNKLNYGDMGMELRLKWEDGIFVREGQQAGAPSPLAAFKVAEDAFLACLAMFESQNRDVSPNSGKNYAPAQFAKLPEANGCNRRQLADAMERLLAQKVIRFAIDNRVPSKPRRWLTTKPEPASEPAHDPETGEVYESAAGSRLEAAKRFLREFLADGPRTAGEVKAFSLDGMIAEKTLHRAAKALGVRTVQKGRSWTWSLPA